MPMSRAMRGKPIRSSLSERDLRSLGHRYHLLGDFGMAGLRLLRHLALQPHLDPAVDGVI